MDMKAEEYNICGRERERECLSERDSVCERDRREREREQERECVCVRERQERQERERQ
jgi:hypothetical protein